MALDEMTMMSAALVIVVMTRERILARLRISGEHRSKPRRRGGQSAEHRLAHIALDVLLARGELLEVLRRDGLA